ncbi:hypothetical protein HK097_009864 [Rhizophlyctis rosea]|uniref:Uncharacterized protein n=1 Tax=Rhizophlyctis rosea TaxID=64517 RepID=A0AAD5SG82_9FUNG|nr:hypothetical protein HK097_009864 [Rhizophlyctis rosea]
MDFDDGPEPPNFASGSGGFSGRADSFDDFHTGGHTRKGKGHSGHHEEKIVDQNFFNGFDDDFDDSLLL